MSYLKFAIRQWERQHPYLFIIAFILLCTCVLLAASAVLHACGTAQDGQAQPQPPIAALKAVEIEGSGHIKALAQIDLMGSHAFVQIEGSGGGEAQVVGGDAVGKSLCAVVTFRWGVVRFTQDHPAGCRFPLVGEPAAQAPSLSSPQPSSSSPPPAPSPTPPPNGSP